MAGISRTVHPQTAVHTFLAVRPDLRGQRLVVAVSGGPDSVALAHALAAAAPAFDLHLALAHLDHGLRPEAPQDARRVAQLGQALGLDVVVEPSATRSVPTSTDGLARPASPPATRPTTRLRQCSCG
jgi:tRNA(Ile)-lysidine synthase TilS/MesJ